MLGIRTRGGRIEGSDESTELWPHPNSNVNIIVTIALEEGIAFGLVGTLEGALVRFRLPLDLDGVDAALDIGARLCNIFRLHLL